jgi:hypothetical protein
VYSAYTSCLTSEAAMLSVGRLYYVFLRASSHKGNVDGHAARNADVVGHDEVNHSAGGDDDMSLPPGTIKRSSVCLGNAMNNYSQRVY